MRAPLLTGLLLLLSVSFVAADVADYLLPNGEPIVGVYYYSWYGGEPYRQVGWTPEFEYDNRTNDGHIHEVVKAMTDYGINQASYSYWDNDFYLNCMGTHLDHAEQLAAEGRPCYFSPYLEPRTIDKTFANPDAIASNVDFIGTFTKKFGDHPAFCTLGGVPFSNIYVTYYSPDEADADFRAFLEAKYGTMDALLEAWTGQEGYEGQMLAADAVPDSFDGITLAAARPGTVAFADRQELRAARLKDGWGQVISGVEAQSGLASRYTGDVSRTIVSPTEYMDALTGMSWYSFGYALTDPTRRPKLISEVSKYTGTTFLNTIAPGYVDRQQRWTGGRVERDPYLYPYAWAKAIQSLPEGIMILTHSEWFEGSIIDVTKEYGTEDYETTELYSSVFRNAFRSICDEKRDKEPIAVIFNEWATYGINEGGRELDDIYGLIKLLECLNLDYDVIPESFLSEEELAGRQIVLVPNCGVSLAPGHNELLLDWARKTPTAKLIVDRSTWWANALDLELDEGSATIGRYRCEAAGQWIEALGPSFEGLKIHSIGACYRVGESEGDAPKILGRRYEDDGRGVIFFNGRLGAEFQQAFAARSAEGRVPRLECEALLALLKTNQDTLFATLPEPPSDSFEIKAGPALNVNDTIVLPAGNVLPWGYIADHRAVGWGLDQGHSAEETKPWKRLQCQFSVPVSGDLPVSEVQALDSDSGRFIDLGHSRNGNTVSFMHPMKFQAVFAIVQSPAKLLMPAMTVQPGATTQLSVEVANVTNESHECTLRLKHTPGLTMEPVTFTLLPAGQTTQITIDLVAGTDYASGNRTAAFDLETGGRTATFWRPVTCTLPASIGTRTAVLGGTTGSKVARKVTLVNVGECPATDMRLTLLDGEVAVGDLNPREERTAEVSFTIPQSRRAENVPDTTVSLTLGRGKVSQGMTTQSGGDGQFRDITVGGRPASVPIGGADGNSTIAMIYLWVDDAVLPPGDYDLEAVVEYFDQGTGRFMIEYDSIFGDSIEDRFRDSIGVSLLNTNTWKTAVIPLEGARLAGRQNGAADLRVNGIVPVGTVTLRGLRSGNRRSKETMTVSYKQFGHPMTQDLALDLLAADANPAPNTLKLNPYGTAAPGYHDGTNKPVESGLSVTNRLADEGLLVVENPYLSAVWDSQRGGLVSLFGKVTQTDYAAFPGPMIPMSFTPVDGEAAYFAPADVKLEDSKVLAQPAAVTLGSRLSLEVQDIWSVAPDAPHITLDRYIVPQGDMRLADFTPAVLRLDPELFSQVLPLGVGFGAEGQPMRGWLETWYSDGWYFAFSGDPNNAGHGLAMTVRTGGARDKPALRRFRYGFFPSDGLPAGLPGRVADDELQIRLRGNRELSAQDRIHVIVDIYLLPGGSYKAARELALLNATPEQIRQACTVQNGDWSTLGGVQTVTPSAPLYMFPVRQPYYSAALKGDRQ